MAIDFEVEPEFQAKLDWIREFVSAEVEPLDLYFRDTVSPFDKSNELAMALVAPLQRRVQEEGLWACHLGPELGGKGYGQVRLALMNEILGRSAWAPSVFGCQAPDSGNAEILAHYGTAEQRERYLQPLLEGQISSTYAMTEPQAGADPNEFTCRARRDGSPWCRKRFPPRVSCSSVRGNPDIEEEHPRHGDPPSPSLRTLAPPGREGGGPPARPGENAPGQGGAADPGPGEAARAPEGGDGGSRGGADP